MNPSQLIAWLVCLVLASFAAVLSVNNVYRAKVLEKRFVEVQKAAETQDALLSDIRRVLQQIETDLRQRAAAEGVPAAEAAPPAATTAATRSAAAPSGAAGHAP